MHLTQDAFHETSTANQPTLASGLKTRESAHPRDAPFFERVSGQPIRKATLHHLLHGKCGRHACGKALRVSCGSVPPSKHCSVTLGWRSSRPFWMARICWDTADRIRSSRRLNSSKHPHAPTYQQHHRRSQKYKTSLLVFLFHV